MVLYGHRWVTVSTFPRLMLTLILLLSQAPGREFMFKTVRHGSIFIFTAMPILRLWPALRLTGRERLAWPVVCSIRYITTIGHYTRVLNSEMEVVMIRRPVQYW